MSIITRSIATADREVRYLNVGELDAIRDCYERGKHRLRLAQILTANEERIIEKSSQKFWQRCPDTPSNSGNPTFRAHYKQDVAWYLRLLAHSIIVGDIEPLEKVGLKGAKEMYESMEIPLRNLVECMRCLKESALEMVTLEEATEVGPYFDYLIQGLMP